MQKNSFFKFHYSLILISLFFLSFIQFEKGDEYVFPTLFHFPSMPKNELNPVTNKGVQLGRLLFYDPILSADSTISCASCHKQEYAFSDSPNKYSKGIKNQLQNRNTPPLFNLAWYKKMFWDGRSNSMEDQVFHPVREIKEMNLTWKQAVIRIKRSKIYKKKFKEVFGSIEIDSTHIVYAIAQFERTLLSYNSKYDKVIQGKEKFNLDEQEGFELVNEMNKGDCLHCHTTDGDALGTTGFFANNGLDSVFSDKGLGYVSKNKNEMGQFKIPSFRNLLYTAPYMHDGRFKTLEEVLDFYSEGLKKSNTIDSKMTFLHQGGAKLTKEEKRKIIAFIRSMSDPAFITDKRFSNPFK